MGVKAALIFTALKMHGYDLLKMCSGAHCTTHCVKLIIKTISTRPNNGHGVMIANDRPGWARPEIPGGSVTERGAEESSKGWRGQQREREWEHERGSKRAGAGEGAQERERERDRAGGRLQLINLISDGPGSPHLQCTTPHWWSLLPPEISYAPQCSVRRNKTYLLGEDGFPIPFDWLEGVVMWLVM